MDLGDRIGRLEDTIAALQVELREARADKKPSGTVKPKRTRRPPADSEE